MNLIEDTDRALGCYANTKTDKTIASSILNIIEEVEIGAIGDGADEDDAESTARNVAIMSVANAFQSAGFIELYDVLLRSLK